MCVLLPWQRELPLGNILACFALSSAFVNAENGFLVQKAPGGWLVGAPSSSLLLRLTMVQSKADLLSHQLLFFPPVRSSLKTQYSFDLLSLIALLSFCVMVYL